ncbi:MAG: NAD-dependent epimerase/dehydratase family protein [Pseudomonadota bacterium]
MARVVVMGGYGLIGSACMRALRTAGFEVRGMGRSHAAAHAVVPDVDWVIRDIPSVSVEEWRGILDGVDVVVNASGVLQDGARDDLEAIHVTAVERLVAAAGLAGSAGSAGGA